MSEGALGKALVLSVERPSEKTEKPTGVEKPESKPMNAEGESIPFGALEALEDFNSSELGLGTRYRALRSLIQMVIDESKE